MKSTGATEILAVDEGIDEAKMLRGAFSMVLGIEIDAVVFLDSQDLFDTLSLF